MQRDLVVERDSQRESYSNFCFHELFMFLYFVQIFFSSVSFHRLSFGDLVSTHFVNIQISVSCKSGKFYGKIKVYSTWIFTVDWRLVTHSLPVVVYEPTQFIAVCRVPWKIHEEIKNTKIYAITVSAIKRTTKICVLANIINRKINLLKNWTWVLSKCILPVEFSQGILFSYNQKPLY